jgi:hypothetical protein
MLVAMKAFGSKRTLVSERLSEPCIQAAIYPPPLVVRLQGVFGMAACKWGGERLNPS